MQRGETGHAGPLPAGPDQVKAAVVGQLIGDNPQIAECTVNSRLHLAPRALRLTLSDSPPALHSTAGATCDIDRQGAEPHSLGASGIPEK